MRVMLNVTIDFDPKLLNVDHFLWKTICADNKIIISIYDLEQSADDIYSYYISLSRTMCKKVVPTIRTQIRVPGYIYSGISFS